MIGEMQIPQHVAIIMDGNGRWAEMRGKERYEGHLQGVESVRTAIKSAVAHGVKYLTLYAFSTENWGRPQKEVDALMDILCRSVISETPELVRQGARVRIIGDRSRFSVKVQAYLDEVEAKTAEGSRVTLLLALNYSSRSELQRAVRIIAERVASGEVSADEISESMISNSLYTTGIPDPDLIIRTSGECRLSNFLLWQASYSELYFTDVLWPDFTDEEFGKAIEAYGQRHRKFGLVK